jgi:hypothetical protein
MPAAGLPQEISRPVQPPEGSRSCRGCQVPLRHETGLEEKRYMTGDPGLAAPLRLRRCLPEQAREVTYRSRGGTA